MGGCELRVEGRGLGPDCAAGEAVVVEADRGMPCYLGFPEGTARCADVRNRVHAGVRGDAVIEIVLSLVLGDLVELPAAEDNEAIVREDQQILDRVDHVRGVA
jgi:hypothetical protein